MKLVFCGFWAFSYKMVYFLTVVVLDLIRVTYHHIKTILIFMIFFTLRLSSLGCIDFNS